MMDRYKYWNTIQKYSHLTSVELKPLDEYTDYTPQMELSKSKNKKDYLILSLALSWSAVLSIGLVFLAI